MLLTLASVDENRIHTLILFGIFEQGTENALVDFITIDFISFAPLIMQTFHQRTENDTSKNLLETSFFLPFETIRCGETRAATFSLTEANVHEQYDDEGDDDVEFHGHLI